MTTPEQPDGQGLTRKQLRELQKTGTTPIVYADGEDAAEDDAVETDVTARAPEAPPVEPESEPEPREITAPDPASIPDIPPPPPLPAVHLPRAADPVDAPAPTPDSQVDLGASPLTRRQAREQERIRTASVPVITPEVAAAYSAQWVPPAEPAPAVPEVTAAAAPEPDAAEPDAAAPSTAEVTLQELFGDPDSDDTEVTQAELIDDAPAPESEEGPAPESDESEAEPSNVEPAAEEPPTQRTGEARDASVESAPSDAQHPEDSPVDDLAVLELEPEPEARPLLRPEFGSALLAGTTEAEMPLSSFDELMARNGSSTGSMSVPNALILSQSPSPMVGPVTATGEVLITGSMALPEGLGSRGHAPGVADGKEIDSVLVDGELPAASSPTPIAASAAISTIKGTGEIIRPPAPEKGNRLMLTLAITAGVLALSLVGVLILAFVTGVFR